MSKIGKISIQIPEKVKVLLSGTNINIEGPLGKKSLKIDLEMFDLNIEEGKELVKRLTETISTYLKESENFIVNDKGATARDIETLINHIQNTVKDCFGIDLDTEVRIIGEYDE